MKTYKNNFVDLDKLQKDKSVLVSKCNAECFLLTCKMAGFNRNLNWSTIKYYSQSNNLALYR